jgi:hypothetical protein
VVGRDEDNVPKARTVVQEEDDVKNTASNDVERKKEVFIMD